MCIQDSLQIDKKLHKNAIIRYCFTRVKLMLFLVQPQTSKSNRQQQKNKNENQMPSLRFIEQEKRVASTSSNHKNTLLLIPSKHCSSSTNELFSVMKIRKEMKTTSWQGDIYWCQTPTITAHFCDSRYDGIPCVQASPTSLVPFLQKIVQHACY